MLTVGGLAGLETYCMPVLFKEISLDLNLNLAQIGTIWGINSLAGVFVALPAGLLSDRFGIKRTLIVVCILTGILSALRGFSSNFITLAITMLLFGLFSSIIPCIAPKVTVLWFNHRRIALANAFINVFWNFGSMIGTMTSATVFSPLLGGWRNVIFVFSIPAILLGIMWLITGREPSKNEETAQILHSVSLRKALSEIIHIREVWILGIIEMSFVGSTVGLLGYLSLYLKNSGWDVVAADTATTLLITVGAVGVVPMTILANRFRSIKGTLILSIVASIIGVVILPFVHGAGVYYVLIISGFLRSPSLALANTMLFEINGVGSVYGGTAIGLVTSMSLVGACIAPVIGNSFAVIHPAAPFVFWAIFSALGLPAFCFLRGKNKAIDYAT